MVEIFDDRMEINNPGVPLVDPSRMLDSPPRSRNERLASLMRRMGICEERGSGVTNTTLRERFGIDAKNSATASRLIKEALGGGVTPNIHVSAKVAQVMGEQRGV